MPQAHDHGAGRPFFQACRGLMALRLSSLRGVQAYDKVNKLGSGFSQDQQLGFVHCESLRIDHEIEEDFYYAVRFRRPRPLPRQSQADPDDHDNLL